MLFKVQKMATGEAACDQHVWLCCQSVIVRQETGEEELETGCVFLVCGCKARNIIGLCLRF